MDGAISSKKGSFVKAHTLHFDDGEGRVVPAKRKAAAAPPDDDGGRAAASVPPSKKQQQQQQQQPHSSAAEANSQQQTGIGWSLLRKAGWAPGSGLGRDGTGNVEPLAPRVQRSTRGLGHADERGQVLVGGQVRRAGDAAAAAAAAAAGAAGGSSGRAPGAAAAADGGACAPAGGRAWAGPLTLQQDARREQRRWKRRRGGGNGGGDDDGLPPEVLTAAQRQAAEDARGKAIARALRAEFAAPGTAEAGDTNPLLARRRTRLAATNPLLGSDSEDGGGG